MLAHCYPVTHSFPLATSYIVEWQAIGVALLELARVVNDKVLLSSQSGEAKFDNTSELLKENRAVGAAEAGSYVATG